MATPTLPVPPPDVNDCDTADNETPPNMNTSDTPLVSFGTRAASEDSSPTNRASLLMVTALVLTAPGDWLPFGWRLTRVVVAAWRSRTKTSVAALVSPDTRLVATDEKVMNRPSALI